MVRVVMEFCLGVSLVVVVVGPVSVAYFSKPEKQHDVGRSCKPVRAALSRGKPDFVSLWKNMQVFRCYL